MLHISQGASACSAGSDCPQNRKTYYKTSHCTYSISLSHQRSSSSASLSHSVSRSGSRIRRPEWDGSYLVLAETGDELIFFLDEFFHLGGEGYVGEKEAAILVIVAVFLVGVAE